MNMSQWVNEVLTGQEPIEKALIKLTNERDQQEFTGEPRVLQVLRCTIRFLKRVQQYRKGQLGDADLLSSLRDYILFVGKTQVPQEFLPLVKGRGDEFGLYLEADQNTVNAVLVDEKWFSEHNATFLRQVYGKEHVPLFRSPPSCGDGWLYRATGFRNYRSFEQKVAVHTALTLPEGYTLLLSLPTGAGKSLVTQMVASLSEGLTVLIVPTVALGLDQYRAAQASLAHSLHRDQIAHYMEGLSHDQMNRLLDGIAENRLRLLITSPEAVIRNRSLKEALDQLSEERRLANLVMDEAHMVEDWGAFFRPDFQIVSVMRREWLKRSGYRLKTILLSATVTDKTSETLKSLFSDEERWVEMRCDALRTEPRYVLEKCRSKMHLIQRVTQLCKILPKPMIVYEVKPQDAEEWKRRLQQEGFLNIVTFTGETDDLVRSKIIQDWVEDNLDIVVATSAFGLGVDKPDVRTVLHASLPESINRFYQEVGRGGRDGLPSLSVLCCSPQDDRGTQEYITNAKVLTVDKMVARWFSMLHAEAAERDGPSVILDTATPPAYFTQEEKEQSGQQNIKWNLNLLLFLLRYGYLTVEKFFFVPEKQSYLFKVNMLDVELMQDETALGRTLQVHRQEEYRSVVLGYEGIKEMVSKAESSCWAGYFADLYRHAALSCGGCPAHTDSYCNDGPFTLQRSIPLYRRANPQRVRSDLRQLMVLRKPTQPWEAHQALQLGERFYHYGFTMLVLPSTENVDATSFPGLVLDVDELANLVHKHPSLLTGGGIICSFDDEQRNQVQYHVMKTVHELGIPYLYHCREDMFIQEANRTIRDLLNAVILTYNEAMEV